MANINYCCSSKSSFVSSRCNLCSTTTYFCHWHGECQAWRRWKLIKKVNLCSQLDCICFWWQNRCGIIIDDYSTIALTAHHIQRVAVETPRGMPGNLNSNRSRSHDRVIKLNVLLVIIYICSVTSQTICYREISICEAIIVSLSHWRCAMWRNKGFEIDEFMEIVFASTIQLCVLALAAFLIQFNEP